MKDVQFHNGMIVFWQDPAGINNPDEDASKFDILCNVDIEENYGWLAGGTEVYLSECRPISNDELNEYIQLVDGAVYACDIIDRLQ